jgi:Asp/Glu/Hydantoin racemase
MEKIVKLTEAKRDQDHIKMIVEQNPQIPDRTDHPLHQGTDPTIALFATCKKLEAAEADLIAIPCNTAHAFVDRMQSHLRIPVLNMLDEAMAQIASRYAGRLVGLLATSGTIESGVYAAAAERAHVQIMQPDEEHQVLVMDAIYGVEGRESRLHRGEVPKRSAFGDRSSRATRGRGYTVGLHRTAIAVPADGKLRCCGADSCPIGPYAAFSVGLCQARSFRVGLTCLDLRFADLDVCLGLHFIGTAGIRWR